MTTNAFRALHESPRGFNFRFVIKAEDLTQSTVNTAQNLTLITLPAFSVVKSAATFLKTPFADTTDSAFNNTAIKVGDAGDDDRFITAQQINVNGTEVLAKAQAATTPFAYEAATAVVLNVGSMTAKALEDLNVGELHVFLEVSQLDAIS